MTFIFFPWLLGFPRMFDPNLLMKHISFSAIPDIHTNRTYGFCMEATAGQMVFNGIFLLLFAFICRCCCCGAGFLAYRNYGLSDMVTSPVHVS